MKTASLLVTVMAFALSSPMAVHANMIDNSSSDHHAQHMDIDADIIVLDHNDHTMSTSCDMNHGPSDTSHQSTDCCSFMCGSAVLLSYGNTSFKDDVHTHFALPLSQLASADSTRLMRPPSL